MKNYWKKLFSLSGRTKVSDKKVVTSKYMVNSNPERRKKIEKGAADFAVRFEDVMKELANG